MDTHYVYATTADGTTHRVSDPLPWGQAQSAWNRLDENRRAGCMPHVRHFEVRSTDDTQPRFAEAKTNPLVLKVVVANSRGHKHVADAARVAWKLHFPTFRSWYDRRVAPDDKDRRTGTQGRGGWYYFPNGQTAAQGLTGLAPVAKKRGMVVHGADGRWYVVDTLDFYLDDLTTREARENVAL